jgi:hypothetical protein
MGDPSIEMGDSPHYRERASPPEASSPAIAEFCAIPGSIVIDAKPTLPLRVKTFSIETGALYGMSATVLTMILDEPARRHQLPTLSPAK